MGPAIDYLTQNLNTSLIKLIPEDDHIKMIEFYERYLFNIELIIQKAKKNLSACMWVEDSKFDEIDGTCLKKVQKKCKIIKFSNGICYGPLYGLWIKQVTGYIMQIKANDGTLFESKLIESLILISQFFFLSAKANTKFTPSSRLHH